jgi:hypothetical protein
MDLNDCIPKDKFDIDALELAGHVGFPKLNSVLPDLLTWVQDANWPIAPQTASLLSQAGSEISPHIKAILNSDDAVWKYWTIDLVVRHLSPDILVDLRDDLAKLANHPSQVDQMEGVDVVAKNILNRLEIT